MGDMSEHPALPGVGRGEVMRQARDLYRTTDLSVSAIAAKLGISRQSVYRWLHREGIPLGRNANTGCTGPTQEDLTCITSDIAQLRRELVALLAHVSRLEGFVKALMVSPEPRVGRETVSRPGPQGGNRHS
jgi:transposase-like protein